MAIVNNPGLLIPSKPVQDSSISPLIFGYLKKCWDMYGKMSNPVVLQTVAFTPGDAYFYPVGDVGAGYTITLPPAISCKGKEYVFKRTSASTTTNNQTILVTGTDTIDGLVSVTLRQQYDTLHIKSDGVSTWHIISSTSGLGYNKPYFDAEKQADQAIGAGAATKVTWPTVNYDTASFWDAANNRYTPKVKGDYHVQGCLIHTSATLNTAVAIYIYKNGAQYGRTMTGPIYTANLEANGPFTNIVPMNGTTDYIEIFVYFGAAGNIYGAGAFGVAHSHLEIKLLAQT